MSSWNIDSRIKAIKEHNKTCGRADNDSYYEDSIITCEVSLEEGYEGECIDHEIADEIIIAGYCKGCDEKVFDWSGG